MATLYVIEPGSRIEKEYQRILVTKEDKVLQSVPARLVDEVVLIGSAGATTQSMLSLLDQGTSMTIITQSGRLRGRLQALESPNLGLRKQQYLAAERQAFRIHIVKSILLGKLKNSRVMSMRIIRKFSGNRDELAKLERQLTRIEEAIEAIPNTNDENRLRGLEGSAAKAYFAIFKAGLNWDDEHAFTKRNRRPPKDPVNVLLSLGYSLCSDALLTACEVVGLDPFCGFLHTEQSGRPSLALDLVEEFRSIIVDSVVLRLVNKHMIKPSHFEYSTGNGDQVILKSKGMKSFLREYNRRLNTTIFHTLAGRSIAYRKCFEVQARQIRKMIEGSQQDYLPLTVR
jgi:CRISPR-associated protein Cas1